MDALELARWQFGITTVYHFLFVPVTIGLGFLVAGMQTAWYRTGDEKWLRATKFFGRIFLINFAIGVVTGIVQEFQFGMNWSDYSRFVGDIFGAPLAIEGLLAFFLESTFLGLWIFGWDRLPKKVHLATIWLASAGTLLSAYFILAANSFMQHPVGYTYNPETGRAELTDFVAVLTQNTAVSAFFHTITSAFLTAGSVVAGISAYLLLKGKSVDVARATLRYGVVVVLVSFVGVFISGDIQSKIMTEQQPMKMAAAEGLYESETGAAFSVLTIGTLDGTQEVFSIKIPKLLSWLATQDVNAEVKGVNNLKEEYAAAYPQFADMSFVPNIPTAYWSFRLMIGLGGLAALFALYALWATRKGRAMPNNKWVLRGALAMPFLPVIANSFGWIFTELGRQPWLVFGLLPTRFGVSPGVSVGEVLTTMIGFTVLYGVLAVIEFGLIIRAVKLGAPDKVVVHEDVDTDRPLTFAY